MVQKQKETAFLKILGFMRHQLKKDGLYVNDSAIIEFPNIVCIGWVFAFSYYFISFLLILTGTASFWTLILNSFCLARAISKTTRKYCCYTKEFNIVVEKSHLDTKTKFFLKNCCKAYIHTQIREIVLAVVILFAAGIIFGLSDVWFAPVIKFIASIALIGAAWDDFLCETEDLYGAYPPIPRLP